MIGWTTLAFSTGLPYGTAPNLLARRPIAIAVSARIDGAPDTHTALKDPSPFEDIELAPPAKLRSTTYTVELVEVDAGTEVTLTASVVPKRRCTRDELETWSEKTLRPLLVERLRAVTAP